MVVIENGGDCLGENLGNLEECFVWVRRDSIVFIFICSQVFLNFYNCN